MNLTIARFPMLSHSRRAARASRRTGVESLIGIVAEWQRRIVERRSLAEMPDRFLRDVGLTRDDLREEIGKPFWRA